MTKILAAEWDGREVRLVSGSASSTNITLDHALSQSIPNDDTSRMDVTVVAAALKDLASKAGGRGGDIAIAVGRGQVELRNLILPKSSPDDLPDMVRFAAMRQFANVGETWPIDFVSLPAASVPEGNLSTSNQEQLEVIAVTLNPATISQIRKVCQEAGLNLKLLGLRPLAAGILGVDSTKSPIDSKATILLVDILTDEADMVVVERGRVCFMRTVQLSRNEKDTLGKLTVGEIRRTLIAATYARQGLKVDKIILWGRKNHDPEVLAQWKTDLNLTVEIIDPFALVESRKSVEYDGDNGKFAPLIGLLSQFHYRMAAKQCPANGIDFLHPRQRPEKKKPIRQYVLTAVAASTLVGAGLWWYYGTHARLDAEIEELSNKVIALEPNLKAAQQNTGHWKKVEKFLEGDIHWLDQLAYLSEKALPADQMILTEATFTLNPQSNQGRVSIGLGFTEQEHVAEFEESLRDEQHKIGTKEIRPSNDRRNAYRWTVDPEIIIGPSKVIDPTMLPKKPSSNPGDKSETAAQPTAPIEILKANSPKPDRETADASEVGPPKPASSKEDPS